MILNRLAYGPEKSQLIVIACSVECSEARTLSIPLNCSQMGWNELQIPSYFLPLVKFFYKPLS